MSWSADDVLKWARMGARGKVRTPDGFTVCGGPDVREAMRLALGRALLELIEEQDGRDQKVGMPAPRAAGTLLAEAKARVRCA